MKRITIDITKTYRVVLDVDREEALDRMLTKDWQSVFYSFADRDQALDFLATLAIGGTSSVHDLDGWADCDPGDLTMGVVDHSTEDMTITEEEALGPEEGGER